MLSLYKSLVKIVSLVNSTLKCHDKFSVNHQLMKSIILPLMIQLNPNRLKMDSCPSLHLLPIDPSADWTSEQMLLMDTEFDNLNNKVTSLQESRSQLQLQQQQQQQQQLNPKQSNDQNIEQSNIVSSSSFSSSSCQIMISVLESTPNVQPKHEHQVISTPFHKCHWALCDRVFDRLEDLRTHVLDVYVGGFDEEDGEDSSEVQTLKEDELSIEQVNPMNRMNPIESTLSEIVSDGQSCATSHDHAYHHQIDHLPSAPLNESASLICSFAKCVDLKFNHRPSLLRHTRLKHSQSLHPIHCKPFSNVRRPTQSNHVLKSVLISKSKCSLCHEWFECIEAHVIQEHTVMEVVTGGFGECMMTFESDEELERHRAVYQEPEPQFIELLVDYDSSEESMYEIVLKEYTDLDEHSIDEMDCDEEESQLSEHQKSSSELNKPTYESKSMNQNVTILRPYRCFYCDDSFEKVDCLKKHFEEFHTNKTGEESDSDSDGHSLGEMDLDEESSVEMDLNNTDLDEYSNDEVGCDETESNEENLHPQQFETEPETNESNNDNNDQDCVDYLAEVQVDDYGISDKCSATEVDYVDRDVQHVKNYKELKNIQVSDDEDSEDGVDQLNGLEHETNIEGAHGDQRPSNMNTSLSTAQLLRASLDLLNDQNIEHTNQTVLTNSIESVPSPSHRHNTIPVFASKSNLNEHQVTQLTNSANQSSFDCPHNQLQPDNQQQTLQQPQHEQIDLDQFNVNPDQINHNSSQSTCLQQTKSNPLSSQPVSSSLDQSSVNSDQSNLNSTQFNGQPESVLKPTNISSPSSTSPTHSNWPTIHSDLIENQACFSHLAQSNLNLDQSNITSLEPSIQVLINSNSSRELIDFDEIDFDSIQSNTLLQSDQYPNSHNHRMNQANSMESSLIQDNSKSIQQEHQATELNDDKHNQQSVNCPKCGKTCKNKDSLRKHIWIVHPKHLYHCEVSGCGKVTKAFANHIRHYESKKHKGINFPCGQCIKFKTTNDLLVNHLRTYHQINFGAQNPQEHQVIEFNESLISDKGLWDIAVSDPNIKLLESTCQDEIDFDELARLFTENEPDNRHSADLTVSDLLSQQSRHHNLMHQPDPPTHLPTPLSDCTMLQSNPFPSQPVTFDKSILNQTQSTPNQSNCITVQSNVQSNCALLQSNPLAQSIPNGHVLVPDKPIGKLVCEVCGKRFKSPSHIASHIRTHTGEKPFACTWKDCGKAFAKRDHFKRHILTHTGEKPFACTWKNCGKAFARRATLNFHIRVHSGEKPFICPWKDCHKAFVRKDKMQVHHMAHSVELPANLTGRTRSRTKERLLLDCPRKDCGKTFVSKLGLKLHLESHDGKSRTSNKHLCIYCSQTFKTSTLLTTHIRTHTGEKPFKCSWKDCDRAFGQKFTLKTHFIHHSMRSARQKTIRNRMSNLNMDGTQSTQLQQQQQQQISLNSLDYSSIQPYIESSRLTELRNVTTEPNCGFYAIAGDSVIQQEELLVDLQNLIENDSKSIPKESSITLMENLYLLKPNDAESIESQHNYV